ncbi:hypothetical protein HPB47_021465 [Ixodes persulcatus]|uniref:Uncharacterized protein n=1 Tax=Ixodes persulcatus TaxID=34615 RepID=A0AC60QCG0_IXOPE|nr:hypothetical protein HPB47_021465 [Ixodes persulcatus]
MAGNSESAQLLHVVAALVVSSVEGLRTSPEAEGGPPDEPKDATASAEYNAPGSSVMCRFLLKTRPWRRPVAGRFRLWRSAIPVLKILRAEWQRQARIYRSLLWTVLQDPSKPRSDNGRLREFLIIVDRTTEFLWQVSLQRLRSTVPKKRPAATGDVKTVSDVDLPADARRMLSLGPKFAVEPRMSAPELLGLVRAVSRCAPVDEERRLSVLPADKEGGFVVLTEGEFGSKALEAISSLTHELPIDNVIQFLDLKLTLSSHHVCWTYQPRANKPLFAV